MHNIILLYFVTTVVSGKKQDIPLHGEKEYSYSRSSEPFTETLQFKNLLARAS